MWTWADKEDSFREKKRGGNATAAVKRQQRREYRFYRREPRPLRREIFQETIFATFRNDDDDDNESDLWTRAWRKNELGGVNFLPDPWTHTMDCHTMVNTFHLRWLIRSSFLRCINLIVRLFAFKFRNLIPDRCSGAIDCVRLVSGTRSV